MNFDILPKVHNNSDDLLPLEEHEKRIILKALEKTYWKISGNFGAASILKLNPETLRSKMRKLGIKRLVE